MRQNTIHSLFEKNFALQCKKVNMSKCSGLRLALFLEDMFPAAENSRSLQVTLLFWRLKVKCSHILDDLVRLVWSSAFFFFFLELTPLPPASPITLNAAERRCAGSTWHKTRPAIGYSLLLLLYWLSKTSGGSLLPHFGHRRFKICTKWAAYGK